MVMTVEERKAANKAYHAKYRAENKEKISARTIAWYEKNKEERKLKNKAWRDANKDVISGYGVKYYNENKEKISVRRNDYAIKYRAENKERLNIASNKYKEENKAELAKYRSENKEKIALIAKKYKEENKDKVNAATALRRAKKFGATVYMTKEDKAKIEELYTIARDATKLFGYDWEVDHIVPLARGGLHKLTNLQVVPGSWNAAKRDRNCDTYWD